MDDLSNRVYAYYKQNFSIMPPDKQFHFASRLHLWNRGHSELEALRQLKAWFTADGQPDLAIKNIIEYSLSSPIHGSKNASELRKPYFEKYPMLKTYVSVLFRINFLKTIYGIDAGSYFFTNFREDEVEKLARDLLADKEATGILSTHAINFLYLYDKLIRQEPDLFNPGLFLEIGQTAYDHENPVHVQLLIYLYTHCIIGDTQFYYRALPENHSGLYLKMLDELEELIDGKFQNINLDNKFEFLVCCRIADRKSRLEERIYQEASQSLSGQGDYLIDRHNLNPQSDNVSLEKSEHRNVLFIMSHSEYEPTVRA